MKIAILVYSYSPESGGVERQAAYLAEALLQRGHEVHLFAKHADAAPNGLAVHRVPARSILPGGRHVAYAKCVREMVAGYDLVHSFTRTLSHDILRLGGGTHREYLERVGEERGPLGVLWSRINPKERAILRLEREGFRKGNYRKIVAVSSRVRDEVVRWYGVPAADIAVIRNGVDTSRFSPDLRETARPRIRRALGLDAFTLLFAGAGFRRKGLRYAIEVLRLSSDVRLLVAGSGNTGPYRALAERLGVDRRVRFLGPRTGIEQLYSAADLLIHPSLYDPFPNVCLEAMACGTPVLTTAVTGVAEIIRDGVDSFVVRSPADLDAMAERIKMAGQRPEIGGAAARTAAAFTIDRNVEENLRIYAQLVAAG